MKIDGRCHCGYITFEAVIEPDKTLLCNCTDCQTFSGSAFRVHAFTREDAFRLLSGEPKIYVKTAESGNKRPQAFCPECGNAYLRDGGRNGPQGLRHPCRLYSSTRPDRSPRAVVVSLRTAMAHTRRVDANFRKAALDRSNRQRNLGLVALGRRGHTDRSVLGQLSNTHAGRIKFLWSHSDCLQIDLVRHGR
jgi:hypothetical protein